MKSKRFQILATTLVTLILSGLVSNTLKSKVDSGFVQDYGMNAPGFTAQNVATVARTCGSGSAPGSYAQFKVGTGGYIAHNIGKGGEHVDLVDSDLKKKEGITNLPYTLPAGELLVFDRLVVEHGTSATSGDSPVNVTDWSKNLPAELKNATLSISSNGKVVFEGRLHYINNEQNEEKGYFELVDPRYLLDEKTYQVTLKMAKQFNDSNDHFVRVTMPGLMSSIS